MDVISAHITQTFWDEYLKSQEEDYTNKEYLLAEQAMRFGIEKTVDYFTGPRKLERKRIAVAAMQGILANDRLLRLARETADELYGQKTCSYYRAVAKAALCFADELMDEAERPLPETEPETEPDEAYTPVI